MCGREAAAAGGHRITPVTDCTAEGVTIGETFVPSRTLVWAAGVQASPAARWLGIPADRAGRAIVEPDLTAPGLPDVFVIGDTASVMQEDGKPVPGIAPAAKQQGGYVASVIRARLSGKPFVEDEEERPARRHRNLRRRFGAEPHAIVG